MQFSKLGYSLKNTVGKAFSKKDTAKGSISPFQAMTTALAGTVGTGNIVGTCQAIAMGGYGAVFWLWIAGLLGMIIKYAEVVLSVHYREKNENGAREALASILWVVNNIPEKQYRYKDLAEYTLDFYRKCLRQTLSAGIEIDSSYFTVRGELLCIE